MADSDVMDDRTLVRSEKTAIIKVPIEMINIADWLLSMSDMEYQRCAPPDHKAAGSSTTEDGQPMSINVEEIGGSLLIQHYAAEIHEAHHCRMVSLTDVLSPAGWTQIQVIWDLRVEEITPDTCRYINLVVSYPTKGFLDVLHRSGQTFQAAALDRQATTDDHNRRETEHYADSLGRAALSRGRE